MYFSCITNNHTSILLNMLLHFYIDNYIVSKNMKFNNEDTWFLKIVYIKNQCPYKNIEII